MNRRIAVLMTCHNRKDKTLACLSRLFKATVPTGFSIEIHLVDDGSIDGTGDAIRLLYPDVIIYQGNGALYWAGGMRRAWSEASKFDYDYYLWLNDDTYVYEDFLITLIAGALSSNDSAVLCSTVVSPTTGRITYGGMTEIPGYLVPNGKLQRCITITGNCVLVPRKIYEAIGFLDSAFAHAIADFDYGKRAIAAGFSCFVAGKIVGECESNPRPPLWCRSDVPLKKRWSSLYSPLGYASPKPFFIYEKRHFGLLLALKHWLSIHVRVLMPGLWEKDDKHG